MKEESLQKIKHSLQKIHKFLEAYVEYHIDEKPVEEGVLTDAQILAMELPVLKSLIEEQRPQNAYIDAALLNEDPEKWAYSIQRHARECVNPNYDYCVCDYQLTELYLTNDYRAALQKAKNKSRDYGVWRVLDIRKISDGSYMTFVNSFYTEGEHYDGDRRAFLHFDYIAQAVGDNKIYKI